MFCPKCGANLIDGAEFCQKCGAQLKKKEEPTPEPEQVYVGPMAAAAPKRSKAPIIIAVCVAVVVLIVTVAIAIPAISRHNTETKIENILTNTKECRPFDSEISQERWQTLDTPTYGEIFDYALTLLDWKVTDPATGELTVSGKVYYSRQAINIYFNDQSSLPYRIECDKKTFTDSDEIGKFMLDMADAYMSNKDFIPSTFPEFCGRTNGGIAIGTEYVNNYFGFKITVPKNDNTDWHFEEDSTIEDYGNPSKKSIEDLSHLDYGDAFSDVMASEHYTGNCVLVNFVYLRNSNGILDDYTDEEIIREFMGNISANLIEMDNCNASTDPYKYGRPLTIGETDYLTIEIEYNYYDGRFETVRDYFAVKDGILLFISTAAGSGEELDEIEEMITAL